jgi:hypothetical protein
VVIHEATKLDAPLPVIASEPEVLMTTTEVTQ